MTTYYSESKKAWLDVSDPQVVNDFQLVAAYNKMYRKMMLGEDIAPNTGENLDALREEMESRHLDPTFKGGKPPAEPQVDDHDEARHDEDEAVRNVNEDDDDLPDEFRE